MQVYGIHRGYEGLIDGDLTEFVNTSETTKQEISVYLSNESLETKAILNYIGIGFIKNSKNTNDKILIISILLGIILFIIMI